MSALHDTPSRCITQTAPLLVHSAQGVADVLAGWVARMTEEDKTKPALLAKAERAKALECAGDTAAGYSDYEHSQYTPSDSSPQ